MMQSERNPERIIEILIFCIFLISYIYFMPRWADPNQNSRLDEIFAIVENHTFQIDDFVSNTVDYAKVGNHFYSDKAPGITILGVPVYAGLRVILNTPVIDRLVERLSNNQAFTSTLREGGSGILKQKVRFAIAQVVLSDLLSALPSALLGVLLFKLLARFTHRFGPRLAVVFGYGLLTPAFAYAGSIYGHQLAAVLLFSAFYLVFMRPQNLSRMRLLLVGLLLGLSVFVEFPSVLIVAILYGYTFYVLTRAGEGRKIIWTTLAGAVFAAAILMYNKAIFGGYFTLGYSESTLWETQHHTGFMSLTFPTWNATWGTTLGVFRGLFVLSPWLLLSIPGFILWWRSRKQRIEFWVAAASVFAFLWFNSSSIMWWGGFSIGPRYVIPMLPFMALTTVFVFRQWGSNLWVALLSGFLFLLSLGATWGLTLAGQAFPQDTIQNPFLSYGLPNWLSGNIARNLGTLLGLKGIWSLVPLLLLLGGLLLGIWAAGRPAPETLLGQPATSRLRRGI